MSHTKELLEAEPPITFEDEGPTGDPAEEVLEDLEELHVLEVRDAFTEQFEEELSGKLVKGQLWEWHRSHPGNTENPLTLEVTAVGRALILAMNERNEEVEVAIKSLREYYTLVKTSTGLDLRKVANEKDTFWLGNLLYTKVVQSANSLHVTFGAFDLSLADCVNHYKFRGYFHGNHPDRQPSTELSDLVYPIAFDTQTGMHCTHVIFLKEK